MNKYTQQEALDAEERIQARRDKYQSDTDDQAFIDEVMSGDDADE